MFPLFQRFLSPDEGGGSGTIKVGEKEYTPDQVAKMATLVEAITTKNDQLFATTATELGIKLEDVEEEDDGVDTSTLTEKQRLERLEKQTKAQKIRATNEAKVDAETTRIEALAKKDGVEFNSADLFKIMQENGLGINQFNAAYKLYKAEKAGDADFQKKVDAEIERRAQVGGLKILNTDKGKGGGSGDGKTGLAARYAKSGRTPG